MSGRVLVVGVGGLGCPAALALVESGVRAITLVDDDVVAAANLHRQILFATRDAGRAKVDVAAAALRAVAAVDVRVVRARVTVETALDLVRVHDVVVDATDSTATKLLLNDACVRAGVALVHGGAVRWQGQALAVVPGEPCLRCVFPDLTPSGPGACGEFGIVGPVVGVVGALQAELALAILDGKRAGGRLVAYDGLAGRTRVLSVSRREDCRCARPDSIVLDEDHYRADDCAARAFA